MIATWDSKLSRPSASAWRTASSTAGGSSRRRTASRLRTSRPSRRRTFVWRLASLTTRPSLAKSKIASLTVLCATPRSLATETLDEARAGPKLAREDSSANLMGDDLAQCRTRDRLKDSFHHAVTCLGPLIDYRTCVSDASLVSFQYKTRLKEGRHGGRVGQAAGGRGRSRARATCAAAAPGADAPLPPSATLLMPAVPTAPLQVHSSLGIEGRAVPIGAASLK